MPEAEGVKTGSSTTVTSRDRCCSLPTRRYNSGSTYTAGMWGTRALDSLRTQKLAIWAARPVGVGGQLWGRLLGSMMGGLADPSTSPSLCLVGMETISHGVCRGGRGGVLSAHDSVRYTGRSSSQGLCCLDNQTQAQHKGRSTRGT